MNNKQVAIARKRAKRFLYIIMTLLMPGFCLAVDNVVISEVLYDPSGTEAGGEAVELYNPTGAAADISGYVVMTESSATDATVPAGTVLAAGKYYLIADAGWSASRDNASWPEADHEEAITMSNTDAGVALALPNGIIIDAVGWGSAAGINAGLYEGTPAADVSAGNSLRRQDTSGDSDDNSVDFVEGLPDLQNSSSGGGSNPSNTTNSSQALDVSVSVTNNAPTVDSVTVARDDDNSTAGTQVIPIPEGAKDLAISAEVSDSDGISGITNVTATITGPGGKKTVSLTLSQSTSNTTAVYNGTVQMNFYDSVGQYTTTVNATDSATSGTDSAQFEYLSMAAISIDASSLQFTGANLGSTTDLLGDFALSTTDTPTIRNVGNTQLDVGLYGTDLADGAKNISIDNMKYSFDNDFTSSLSGTLSSTLQIENLGLANSQDSVMSLGFQLYVPPTTQNGNYTGQVTIVAVSS